MKRIVILIFLIISCANVFAQSLHKIKLNGTTVTVEGDRLIPVKDKQQEWEIDLRKDQEVFQLVSENQSKVTYVLSGKFVNTSDGDFQKIPYLKNSNNFYETARLVLKRDSLPVTISVNNEVIATFQLKQRRTYQKYTPTRNRVYYVGDTIKINKEQPITTDYTITNVDIFLKKGS